MKKCLYIAQNQDDGHQRGSDFEKLILLPVSNISEVPGVRFKFYSYFIFNSINGSIQIIQYFHISIYFTVCNYAFLWLHALCHFQLILALGFC